LYRRVYLAIWKEAGTGNESTGIGKKDLRQVQGDSPAWSGARDLHQSKTQAAPGIIAIREEL
jgi:hypothetical protein